MRVLRGSSEAEMVALFLRTELPAARSRDSLRALLTDAGLPERVVTVPDLADDAENQARLQLLTQHRGYGTRTELFDRFPDDVCWQWIAITPAELAGVRYIDYDYWVELRAVLGWRSMPARVSAQVWPSSGWQAIGCWAWRRMSPTGPGFLR